MNITPELMSQLASPMGGTVNLQNALNNAQQALAQKSMSINDFMQNPHTIIKQLVPEDRLNWAIQQANSVFGRR